MAFAAVLLSVGAVATSAQAMKVGYVNIEQILRESDAAKAAQARLEGEFGRRSKDLEEQDNKVRAAAEALQKQIASLSEDERSRRSHEIADAKLELDRQVADFQSQLDRRRREETTALTDRVERLIKQMGENEHYDLILQENITFYSANADITKKVIDALNAQKSQK
jgi:outer membrane protein